MSTTRRSRAPKPAKPIKVPNPCHLAALTKVTVPTDHYGLRLDFAPSNAQLARYCDYHRYKMIMNWRTEDGVPRPTFDEVALGKLMEKYPKDRLFPLVGRYRQVEKCLGTYVDGVRIDPDGRVRGEFLHTPKTGRLSMKGAPHQLQPRTDDPNNPFFKVRGIYVAAPGHRLLKADFSGIEAVLTAYFSGVDAQGNARPGAEDAKALLRLCRIDVHSYIACHAIGQAADLVWTDEALRAYFSGFRKTNATWATLAGSASFDTIRNSCKTALYASLYMGTPSTLVRSEPTVFPTEAVAAYYQHLIFSMFPSIPAWWDLVIKEADQFGYVVTPDGYRQHHSDVLEYVWLKREARWEQRRTKFAEAAVACKPQHTAMGYTAQGIALFWERYPQYRAGLRLTIHDEILGEWPDEDCLAVAQALQSCMETALPWMPLPPSWGMGTHLAIATEGKWSAVGGSWKEMGKIS